MGWRVEMGASSDYTNEVFYQDAFIDTTFLGRDRIDNPEARVAGVLFTALEGTRSAGGSRYQLQNELSMGNLLQRDVLGLHWVTDVSPEWRVVGTPSVEFRRDESYGRNLTEWRAQASGRARRTFLESATALDLIASADLLRTSGTGSGFVLDRNAARLGAALDQGGFSTFGARAGYALVVRQFPDSSVRSHLEHQSELRLRKDRDQGLSWGLDGVLLRRVTLEPAPTSRDNWWQEGGVFDAEWRDAGTFSLRAAADLDAIQYDVQDSTVYFNYSTLRVLVGPRFSRPGRASVWLAPRLEWLAAPLSPGEAYREFAAQAEIEVIARGTLLSATPVVGHREYHDDPASLTEGDGSLHSSYAFYEIVFFFDQALRGGWRLRHPISRPSRRATAPTRSIARPGPARAQDRCPIERSTPSVRRGSGPRRRAT